MSDVEERILSKQSFYYLHLLPRNTKENKNLAIRSKKVVLKTKQNKTKQKKCDMRRRSINLGEEEPKIHFTVSSNQWMSKNSITKTTTKKKSTITRSSTVLITRSSIKKKKTHKTKNNQLNSNLSRLLISLNPWMRNRDLEKRDEKQWHGERFGRVRCSDAGNGIIRSEETTREILRRTFFRDKSGN